MEVAEQQEDVTRFVELTHATPEQAAFYLEASGHQFDRAVQMFFGEPLQPPRSWIQAPFSACRVRLSCESTAAPSADTSHPATRRAEQHPASPSRRIRPHPPDVPPRPLAPATPRAAAPRPPQPPGLPPPLGAVLALPFTLLNAGFTLAFRVLNLGVSVATVVAGRLLPRPVMRALTGGRARGRASACSRGGSGQEAAGMQQLLHRLSSNSADTTLGCSHPRHVQHGAAPPRVRACRPAPCRTGPSLLTLLATLLATSCAAPPRGRCSACHPRRVAGTRPHGGSPGVHPRLPRALGRPARRCRRARRRRRPRRPAARPTLAGMRVAGGHGAGAGGGQVPDGLPALLPAPGVALI